MEERCQEVLDSLPRCDDELGMLEGRIAWDLPTELRTTIECMLVEEVSFSFGSRLGLREVASGEATAGE